MKHTLRFSILFTLMMLGFDFLGMGQRTLPYPIILVHGWTDSDADWYDFAAYLHSQIGLNVDLDNVNRRANLGSKISFKYYDKNNLNLLYLLNASKTIYPSGTK